MKAIERYECEVCHRIYPSQESAEKCEKMHMKPEKILDSTFAGCDTAVSVYMYGDEEPHEDYPETIKVKFGNGATRTYFSRRMR